MMPFLRNWGRLRNANPYDAVSKELGMIANPYDAVSTELGTTAQCQPLWCRFYGTGEDYQRV